MVTRLLTLVVGTVIIGDGAWAADAHVDAPARASHAQAEHDQLVRRLDRIEAGLQRLEANETDHWLTRRRAAEIRELVRDVLGDADARTTLKDTDLTGGWDDGFFLQSPDGNFRLEVSGQLQVRYVWNRRRRSNGTLDTRDGFAVRRAKIKIDGHLISPDLGYTIGMAQSPARGFVLQSFNVRYRVTDELMVLVGRARPPLLREEQVSSKRQLAMERSLVSKAFSQTRTVGVMLRYRDDLFRVSAGVMDASVGNVDPSAPVDELIGELAPGDRWRASARAEVLLRGRWKEIDDFTSFPGDTPTVALGTGVMLQWEDLLPIAGVVRNNTNLLRWTADITVEFGGANIFAYVIGTTVDEKSKPILHQFGAVVQAGIFVTDEWELFGRYEAGETDGVGEELSVLTVGANHYFSEHELKWTMDVGYGFNPVDSFWSSRRAAWLKDDAGEAGQLVVRMQMQMLF